jgi:predicted nuclease of predicted toxin-antitoxin system
VSLRYYFDHHVQGPVAEGLRRRGLEVITAKDDGARQLPDESLLARATELGCVLVTNDEDLVVIASAWQATGRPFAGIVYMTRQQIPYGKLIEDLQLIAEGYTPDEMVNRVEYVPL